MFVHVITLRPSGMFARRLQRGIGIQPVYYHIKLMRVRVGRAPHIDLSVDSAWNLKRTLARQRASPSSRCSQNLIYPFADTAKRR